MENTDESAIQALYSEVEFYRQNQAIVEQEIKTLISDNQKLSQQVGTLLQEKLQYTQQTNVHDQSKELEELKKQNILITKERDSLHVLWQTSQKTIDALETELEAYQNFSGKRNKENINEKRRDLELKLETAINDYLELESKYKTVFAERNSLESNLNAKEKEKGACLEKCKTLERELALLKKNLDEYKVELLSEKKSHDDVKCQLELAQKQCVDIVKKEAEAKLKVAEALQLFDLVSNQKNDANKKIAQLTKEVLELQSTLAYIKRSTEEDFRRELDEVKRNYNEKVSDMLQHIKNLDAELVEKGLLLNKTLRDNQILRTENESYVQKQKDNLNFVDPKLVVAEQRLESAFQELVASERRNIQLICEKQSLALDLQKTLDNHMRECKRRDWEEGILRTQCQELKLQVEHLQKSLDGTHEMITKLQAMLSSRTELNNKMVSTKEEELLDLNKHLENQMELNKKWKESYVDMTEKLKKQLEMVCKENKELRVQLNLQDSNNQSSVNSS